MLPTTAKFDIMPWQISKRKRDIPLQYTSCLWVQKQKLAMNYLPFVRVNSPNSQYKSALESNKEMVKNMQ
jgi:hypothetical protein